jgi:hypothetical protein
MKPGDFFVGVSEFFAILLPGAVLTFAGAYVANRFGVRCNGLAALGLTDASEWWALAVVAYTVGHIVASWGSRLDVIYDEEKKVHRNAALKDAADELLTTFLEAAGQVAKKAQEPKLRRSFFAYVVARLTGGAWELPDTDEPNKDEPEKDKPKPTVINAYKLSRIRLSRRAPTLYREVIRLEADSKFFRSLVVVATLALPAWIALLGKDGYALRHPSLPSVMTAIWDCVFLAATFATLRLAYARFCELRLKATETAFQGLVYLSVEKDPA